jgi:hypothetical protein
MSCVTGAVPVTIRPPHPQNLQTTLPTVRMIVDVSKSVLVLSNQNVMKLLKSKVFCLDYWLLQLTLILHTSFSPVMSSYGTRLTTLYIYEHIFPVIFVSLKISFLYKPGEIIVSRVPRLCGSVTNNSTWIRIGYRIYSLWRFITATTGYTIAVNT